MTQPTLEQQEEMARWVGLTQNYWTKDWFDQHTSVGNPDFTDLSTLFKLVVPQVKQEFDKKALHEKWDFYEFLNEWVHDIVVYDKDPGLALFWAVYRLMKEE